MTSSTRSQSARRYWIALITHSRVSLTPSCSAIFWPSSIWNPGTGPVLLANGSALGLAQSVNAPRSITVSSERASAGALQSVSSERLAAYLMRGYRGFPSAESALVIEPPNVGQDRDDLAVTEHRTIGGHGADLALLDTLDDVFVAALGLRQFWPSARMAAAILVTKAAGGGEHLAAFDVVRRGFGLRQRICRTRRGGLLGKREGRQPWPDDGQGSSNHKRYSHSGIRIHRDVLARGGNVTARAATYGPARAAGRDRFLPPTPSSLPEREDNQRTGILRHAREGLAIERDKLVGHQAAPARRYGDILLAAGHVAYDAGVMPHAVVA